MIELFYIGHDFYFKSGTEMSSIYEVGTYKRYDWGFAQKVVENGDELHVRPATKDEMNWAKKQLEDIRRRNEA